MNYEYKLSNMKLKLILKLSNVNWCLSYEA